MPCNLLQERRKQGFQKRFTVSITLFSNPFLDLAEVAVRENFLQAQDESIIINGDITLTVLKIEGDEVVLGIDAPQWLAIEERPDVWEIAEDAASLPVR